MRSQAIHGTLVVVLAILLAGTAGAWTQLGGGPQRTGVATLPPAPLDVVANASPLADGERLLVQTQPGIVETPQGAIGIALDSEGTCTLLHLPSLRNIAVERRPVSACDGGETNAYDAPRDQIIACSVARGGTGPAATGVGQEPLLLALDPETGEPRWTLTPSQVGIEAATTVVRCGGVALEGDRAIVPIWYDEPPDRYNGHRIAMVNLTDGSMVWTREIPATTFGNPQTLGLSTGGAGFVPFQATLLANGVVVTGVHRCACTSQNQWATAWLNRQGVPIGGTTASDPASTQQMASAEDIRNVGGAWTAAGRGPVAVHQLGDRSLLINPTEAEPLIDRSLDELSAGVAGYARAAPIWTESGVILPLDEGIKGLDPSELTSEWTWWAPSGWSVASVVGTAAGELYVLLVDEDVGRLQLFRLDAGDGREIQRLPLPARADLSRADTWDGRLVPMEPDGVAVVGENGAFAYVSNEPIPERVPGVEASHTHPAPAEPIELTAGEIEPAPSAWRVHWGDGSFSEAPSLDGLSHAYGEAGDHRLLATAIYPDGSTGTRTLLIHVGETPPRPLNLMQRAFAPENQDLTFGLLGLALTLTGGLITVVHRRRRRSVLSEHLARLDEIGEAGRQDPLQAAIELQRFRREIRNLLEAGDLDDRQVTTLEIRIGRLLTTLRNRLIAPYEEALSPRWLRAWEAAFEDGALSSEELDRLTDHLEAEEDLTAAERDALAGMLRPLTADDVTSV